MPITFRLPIRSTMAKMQPQRVSRGQLYNLDDNEFFNFQFNPIVEPIVETNWADDPWLGRSEIHSQYLGTGQTQFELPLQFVVDPGAPIVENNCNPSLVDAYGYVQIENIVKTLNRWTAIRQDKRRPSLVRIILGEVSFSGRILLIAVRTDDKFRDGRIRRATIRIGFKEWRTINNLK